MSAVVIGKRMSRVKPEEFQLRSRIAGVIALSGLIFAILNSGIGCAKPLKNAAAEKLLFHPVDNHGGRFETAQRPRIIRHRFVKVDFSVLSDSGSGRLNSTDAGAFSLNLFNDANFKAIQGRREVRSDKSFTWFGRVEGIDGSQATLVVEDRVLVGNINVLDAIYQVRYAGESFHVIYQIDPASFPADSAPEVLPDARR